MDFPGWINVASIYFPHISHFDPPKEKIAKWHKRNITSNIVLSQATLEEDIAHSRWTLYRGTTAAIQAAVAGLRPIYLMLSDELTVDPLYELKDWRTTVESA